VDFDTHIIPLLTRNGCNSGSCHGSAAGRGGLRLSLYGSRPQDDHDALALELEGRRVNSVRPTQSLVYLKATESLPHGGGPRFDPGSPAARRLLDWIAGGAERHAPGNSPRRLEELLVTPVTAVLPAPGSSVAIQVQATFSDGLSEDVTAWTVLTAEDPDAVQIQPDSTVTAHRPGQHILIARFLDRVRPVELLVPFQQATASPDTPARRGSDDSHQSEAELSAAVVDRFINDRLQLLRLSFSPACDDVTFLRRARLKLTGRVPEPDEVRAMLADTHPRRRAMLVDRLLDSSDFVDFWTHQLAGLLKIQTQGQDATAARTYHAWLRDRIASDAPLDQLARELLTATGDTHLTGPASFALATRDARTHAEFVSELWMGARLRCANCHDHPLDRWTQDDYHGLAAVFAGMRRGRVVTISGGDEIIHPRTGEAARPRIPGIRFPAPEEDSRTAFADWLVSPDNPYFARSLVNRVWQAVMGQGLVNPVDDLRETSPPTHPALLDHLATDFHARGCRLRPMIRTLCLTDAFSRDSTALPGQPSDARFYSHALESSPPPAVFLDMVSDVTGVPESFADVPACTRALELFAVNLPAPSLDLLGRCGRNEACAESTTAAAGLPQALHLINGGLLNDRLKSPTGRIATLMASGASDQALIDEFYLRALSRFPDAAEQEFWSARFATVDSSTDRRQLVEDLVWSLLNCREFSHCR